MLDEPTVGLDPVLRRQLWDTFAELARAGAALIVSSHVMDEAERCDRLLLMRDGRLIADDTPEALLARTRHRGRRVGVPCPGRGRRRGMNPSITFAVAHRVLLQLKRDHRTMALLLVVPCVLLVLLWWMFDADESTFNELGPPLLAMFPFIVMFLVTSVTTLRERSSGTLERLLSMPMAKLDLLVGYALAFGLVALVQSLLAVGSDRRSARHGPPGPAVGAGAGRGPRRRAWHDVGLFVSAFAETEFQAVQFMPALCSRRSCCAGCSLPATTCPPC